MFFIYHFRMYFTSIEKMKPFIFKLNNLILTIDMNIKLEKFFYMYRFTHFTHFQEKNYGQTLDVIPNPRFKVLYNRPQYLKLLQ